ncbi:class I SAM-dependent methyltransferase [Mangrovactinospora gilvigrisea]|nr:methyltransferase domain-containing protein [Mangrovactinospora gilvigrisea]
MSEPDTLSTAEAAYTQRLITSERSGLKRLLPTQAPYHWNLRSLGLGGIRVLDIGCGIGRNLAVCGAGSVGVDHNPSSVAAARARGLVAFTADELIGRGGVGRFDALLCAHVLEHLTETDGTALLASYLPMVRPGGLVVLITPQEAGFASDPTHIRFVDADALRAIASRAGLEELHNYSFPLPRRTGRVFRYNEFVYAGTVPGVG